LIETEITGANAPVLFLDGFTVGILGQLASDAAPIASDLVTITFPE
jgi:hypothetical protein